MANERPLTIDDLFPKISKGLCQCGCGQPTRISPKNVTAKGWRRGEPRSYVHGHQSVTSDDDKWYEFWLRVQMTPGGCWNWIGAINKRHKYGVYTPGRLGEQR